MGFAFYDIFEIIILCKLSGRRKIYLFESTSIFSVSLISICELPFLSFSVCEADEFVDIVGTAGETASISASARALILVVCLKSFINFLLNI